MWLTFPLTTLKSNAITFFDVRILSRTFNQFPEASSSHRVNFPRSARKSIVRGVDRPTSRSFGANSRENRIFPGVVFGFSRENREADAANRPGYNKGGIHIAGDKKKFVSITATRPKERRKSKTRLFLRTGRRTLTENHQFTT